MIQLSLFLLCAAHFSGSVGFVFPDNHPTGNLLGPIYSLDLACAPWSFNQTHIGLGAKVAYKQGNPFSNDYLKNPDLHVTFTSIGLAPDVRITFADIFSVGCNISLNYTMLSYPDYDINTTIDQTVKGFKLGSELYAAYTPFLVRGFRIGLECGVYINGRTWETYYYDDPPDPTLPCGIFGAMVKVRVVK